MKKKANVLILLLAPALLFAQTSSRITGKVIDEKKQALEGATISAMNEKSGLFIKHAVSNRKGEFTISGLPAIADLILIISFTGYRDTLGLFDLTNVRKVLNTGTWQMKEGRDELEEVVVTGRRPPFIVKKDTIEFNAGAFKSLPADMVQDLLRKMPGMVVDEQGNITVNGKKVNKIKVDGRNFFGDNIKLALENLPGLTIDKVQVYETREPGDELQSVIQPMDKELTLNLKLKKQYNKGTFGMASAGAGTEKRYNGNLFANSFKEENRLSFFGNTGNTENLMMMRSRGGNMTMSPSGSGRGIANNNSMVGLNYSRGTPGTIAGNGNLDINYMFNNNSASSTTITDRTNFLDDSSFLYNSVATSKLENRSHRLGFNYRKQIDSLQQLDIAPTISAGSNYRNGATRSASNTTAGKLINDQDNRNVSDDKTLSISNTLNYLLSSADRKSNLRINWSINYSSGSGSQSNRNDNSFYDNGNISKDSLDQYGNTDNNGISNNLGITFNRKLNNSLVAIFGYNFSQNADNFDKDVFNYNDFSDKHDLLDSTYSIHNRNAGLSHLPTASLGYAGKNISVEIGAGMRFTRQENKILWKDSSVKVVQQNFAPRLSFSYKPGNNFQLVTNYSIQATQPTPEQLAPVQDNTNPLYIRLGNPFLKTAIAHNFSSRLSVNTADFKWRMSLVLNGNIVGNQIVDDTYFDDAARQISTYRNVNGSQRYSIDLEFGGHYRFGKDLSLNFGFSPGLNYNNEIGFVQQVKNTNRAIAFSPEANIAFNASSSFSLVINTSAIFNNTSYSLDAVDDIRYDTKQVMVFARWAPAKRFFLISHMFYGYNSQLPDGFQKSRTILNGSVEYLFLRSRKLGINLSVNDILNQNVTVTRTVSPLAVENVQVNALRRFGMITLRYRLNDFGI